MFTRFLLLLCSLIILTNCSTSKDNTEPPAPLVKITPNLTVKTLWTADIGSDIEDDFLKLVPTIYENQLYTASPKGHLRIFNLSDGQRIREYKIDISISGGPGVGEGLILVGSTKGEVVALSETEGTELWRTQLSSEILAVPRINQGIVVVRTLDGKLFGIDSSNGNRLWIYESRVPLLTLRGTSSPLIEQNFIFAGFDNGRIVVLELQTGKVRWEYPVAISRGRSQLERMVDIDAEPLLVDGILYVTSYQGPTVAIDMKTSELLWKKKVSSYAGIDVDFDYLYVSDTKGHLWALDRYSGKDWWKQEKLQARHLTAPVTIGDYVVVGDLEGYLHWMHRDDGQFLTRYQIDKASIKIPPLVINDTLIAYNTEGKIVALQPESIKMN
jgi:outer membrane protein assembly factor BamB